MGQLFFSVVAALRCLKSTVRGALPVDKTPTIKSVRAYNYEYGVQCMK